uniref:Putative secreted peptide n=1 Tax=Anopheles braziliensis TaxID=58242 RepID=A0A2M3ZS88_9DIPT
MISYWWWYYRCRVLLICWILWQNAMYGRYQIPVAFLQMKYCFAHIIDGRYALEISKNFVTIFRHFYAKCRVHFLDSTRCAPFSPLRRRQPRAVF